MKSTVHEIRQRFDNDVERFSNLETGQNATIDAPLVLDLMTAAAAAVNPGASRALDVGCGAGNFALKLHDALPNLQFDLLDLSRPMLDRAVERITAAGGAVARGYHEDVRDVVLEPASYDVIVAAATLHHLRSDDEWSGVFAKLYQALRPGGSLWISDLVEHSTAAVHELMWQRYGAYLRGIRGDDYRKEVFAYIEKEDSPRSLMFQLDLLRAVGFQAVEILHKNSVFAAFGAIK